MVVDASAVIAILMLEPEAEDFLRRLDEAPIRLLSVVTRVELSFVAEGRKGEAGKQDLDRFFARIEHEIVPASARHASLAIEAFRWFGKGRHRAALNMGDCFAYALAKSTGEPLLYKGRDFALTDIRAAI